MASGDKLGALMQADIGIDVPHQAVEPSIAPLFDATTTYAAGDMCTKDGVLYIFTNAHTGAWDAADVTAVNAATYLEMVASAAGVSGIIKCDGAGGFSAQGVDATPTASSTNLVQSGGTAAALAVRPAALQNDVTLYVDGTNGSDSNDGAQATPLKTIMAAVNKIPKNLNGHYVVINVASGTYDETVVINGYYGGLRSNSYFRITGADVNSVFVNGITVSHNSVAVRVDKINVEKLDSGGYCILVCNNAAMSFFVDVNVNNGEKTGYGFEVQMCMVSISSCSVTHLNGTGYGVRLSASIGFISSLSGSGNSIGLEVGSNDSGLPAFAVGNNITITGTSDIVKRRSGIVFNNGSLV